MSRYLEVNGLTLIIIVLVIGAAGGFLMANQTEDQVKKEATAGKEYVEQYTGAAAVVLKHGTLLQLHPGEQYSNPDQIVGNINRPGVWAITKVNQ